MIKTKILLGAELVRHFDETGRIANNRSGKDGVVLNKEFQSKESFDTYMEALEESDGWDGYVLAKYKESESAPGPEINKNTLENEQTIYMNSDVYRAELLASNAPKVICTRCGGTDVSCGGVVNPNTNQQLDLADDAFYDGHCEKCGFAILSDIQYALKSIEEQYAAYKEKNNSEPTYAQCEIVHRDVEPDDINKTTMMVLKLTPEVIESEDDKIFFYCQNYEEFKTFIHPSDGRDFVVIDCQEIY